jgi:predicted nucleic acid-binding protein
VKEAVITDSTCLIGLERIERLDLLPKLFSLVLIPPAVETEVNLKRNWLKVEVPRNQVLVTALKNQLDPGESEAITLALDDLSARKVGLQFNLKVIGTVGLLLRAKRQGILPRIKPLLEALNESNFRISEALVQKALRLSGEESN